MSGEMPTQEKVRPLAANNLTLDETKEAGFDQAGHPAEGEAAEPDENKEINENINKVLDWIRQGAEIQQQILDLTTESFNGDLSGEEASQIIRQFEEIPASIARVAAEFDTAIIALMKEKRGADSNLTWVLGNAARLRGELEKRMAGIEQHTETDDFERLVTMLKKGSEESAEGFMDWSERSLKEIEDKCDELEKLQEEGRTENADKIEELQEDIDDWKGSVAQTFSRFIADSRLHFLRFRTNNYRLLNLRLASSMEGEAKALEVLKFKKQDKELVRFTEQFLQTISKYENELGGRLKELGPQEKK